MRIGLDSFSLHPLGLDPFGQLDWVKAHGFEGFQFDDINAVDPGQDAGRLQAIRAHADGLALETHVGVGGCNPHFTGQPEPELIAALSQRIARAAQCRWHELHGVLGGTADRVSLATPWPEQLAASARVLTALGPILREHGSRINIETHGDVTTFELVRLVEQVGDDALGICLDTANVVLHGEHPVLAARRAAPYTHLVHFKDAAVSFTEKGLRRQTLPPGSGMIDWPALVGELTAHQPGLTLTIEDHKWLFDADLFETPWQRLHPDVSRDEVLQLIGLAWQCQQRIARGELPTPEASDAIPYADELERRLADGQRYLRTRFL